MKKILIVINSLTIGGSEKSLISLLDAIDYSKYEVDLMMFKKGGEFDRYINKNVNIIDAPEYYRFLTKQNIDISFINKIKYIKCRIKTTIELRINSIKSNSIQSEQVLYSNQKKVLENLQKEYDVAIAYSQGIPTYYIVDKVKSNKKLAWINCDYEMTSYDKELDYLYYKNIDKIIAVSEHGKKSIVKVNKEYEDKTEIILDIVNPKTIKKMAEDKSVFSNKSHLNILTVGRLITHYKGYDMAVKAAKLLKDDGYNFKWFSIGEGEHRSEIEKLIHINNLEDNFILLGKKENPYPYMKNCDLYIQPSRNEGFGLTVIEAKILKKLIVCTNFNTAKEIIDNEKNGLIVESNEKDIYLGIKRYLEDENFKHRIANRLKNETEYNSLSEIEKIYDLIHK